MQCADIDNKKERALSPLFFIVGIKCKCNYQLDRQTYGTADTTFPV